MMGYTIPAFMGGVTPCTRVDIWQQHLAIRFDVLMRDTIREFELVYKEDRLSKVFK